MFAVIFEVQPKTGRFDEYLGLAKVLRPELEAIDGFLHNERFRSLRHAGRLLSFSTWRDEKALIRWRTLAIHHKAQEAGRFEIFGHYHLRVGEIAADTAIDAGRALPQQRLDETEVGQSPAVTISEFASVGEEVSPPAAFEELVADAWFESIGTPGKRLLLAPWSDRHAADAWVAAAPATDEARHRCIRIIRDYGNADRREAPQYYPPVPE